MIQYPSKYIEKAIDEISKLPGIGKKTALRLALHLLKEKKEVTHSLAIAINDLRDKTKYCTQCHNISDDNICNICQSHRRDKTIVCVVEDVRDVMAIENTGQYRGIYHVLGGKISPMDGIGPSQLKINSLIEKVNSGKVEELIFALSSTMEGDTTNFYIYKQIQDYSVLTSTIARGISVGDELEYADEITLGRSILNRIPFEASLKS